MFALAARSFAACCIGLAALSAQARELAIGFLLQADDERYSAQALEKAYPDAPSGRSAVAAKLALDDAAFTLQSAGWTGAKLVVAEAADAAGLGAALDSLVKQGIRHVILELPAAGVTQAVAAARGKDLLLVNAAAAEDALRGPQCAAFLLHTLPSHAMQADALAQLLVSRKWNKPLVLSGPSREDALLLAAFQRSAKRFGIKPAAQRAFKLSADPRERELGNIRLLTASADYDVVAVLDAAGEFARELPYRTVLPRPVVGSSGLTAQAWSPFYERNGAPQLSRRFSRRSGRAMGSYDWASWMAARAIVEAVAQQQASGVAQQLKALKQGEVAVDGYKGQRLSFRAWDGQLRQPMLLAHGNGLVELAPVEGFLHQRTALDTLGYDLPETGCKTP
jgi:ABC transporter substrate binding protein (PQQ-dependent alcohol dehydrogenase system)